MKNYIIRKLHSTDKQERGQILAILALAMVGLLVAAGLAVDGGVLFLRKAQLDRATDAAALRPPPPSAITPAFNMWSSRYFRRSANRP